MSYIGCQTPVLFEESEDIGCGIFDSTGQELCESETSPMHIGSLPFYIRGFMRKLEGKIFDGDIIIHNHPIMVHLIHQT